MSFPRVCGQLSLVRKRGLRWSGQSKSQGSLILSGQLYSTGGKVRSQAAEWSSEGQVWAGSVPSDCVCLLAAPVPLPLNQEGLARAVTQCGSGCGLWQSTGLLLVHCPLRCQMPSLPHSDATWSLSWLALSCLLASPAWALLVHGSSHPVWSGIAKQVGPEWALGSGGGMCQGSGGKLAECSVVSICFLDLVLGVSMCVCTLHKWSLGFYSPSWSPTDFLTSWRDSSFFLLLDPRIGMLSVWLEQLTPQEGRISLFWVPSQGHRSWPDCFSSLPTQFHLDCSYGLYKSLFASLWLVSLTVVPCVNVCVCVCVWILFLLFFLTQKAFCIGV